MKGNGRNPDKFLSGEVLVWEGFWLPKDYDKEKVARALIKLRAHTLKQTPPIVTMDGFMHSVNTFKKNSKGVDNWLATELKELPKCVASDLVSVLNISLQIAVTPHQNLLSLNPCLGKPGNGVRTICKTPMIVRNLSRTIFGDVKKWEEDNLQTYDSAARGASALQAALLKNLMAEIAYWNNETTFCLLADYHTCFD